VDRIYVLRCRIGRRTGHARRAPRGRWPLRRVVVAANCAPARTCDSKERTSGGRGVEKAVTSAFRAVSRQPGPGAVRHHQHCYHFIFVPITIGCRFSLHCSRPRGTDRARTSTVAWRAFSAHTACLKRSHVAVGAWSPGLGQEFEFGMNWSNYSRFCGRRVRWAPRHGGPRRLLLGGPRSSVVDLRLGPAAQGHHLACIWVVAFATMLSAAFIMAANSWMQHPVGYTHQQLDASSRAHRHLALFTKPGLRVELSPRDPCLAHDGALLHAGGLGVAPSPGPRGRRLPPERGRSPWPCWFQQLPWACSWRRARRHARAATSR